MKPKNRIILISLIAFVAAIAASFFARGPEKEASPPSTAEAQTVIYWKSRIEKLGTKKAYEEIKKYASDKPFGEGHTVAHIFGKLLYDTDGIDGFSICDEALSYGCYHSFLGRAVGDLGISAIPELAKECHDIYGDADTGCKHGIGHGIMEHEGRGNLLKALELCKETDQKQPLFGCTSGLFMEYNTAMMFRGGEAYVDVRSVDPKKPYAPCDTLESSDFRASCYFEIGLLWKHAYGDDFAKIAGLCSALPNEDDAYACAQGWGTVVAENVDHESEKARAACDLMKGERIATGCRVGVAMRWNGDGVHARQAGEMCAGLSESQQADCRRSIDL